MDLSQKLAKPAVIEISDDEDEPAAKRKAKPASARRLSLKSQLKVAKKEKDLQAFQSEEVLELQKKMAKLEKDYQGACRYARKFELEKEEKQKRVDFLENLLEKKPLISEDAKRANELQKKLDETTKKWEEDKEEAARWVEQLQERVNTLTTQLEEEKSKGKENQGWDVENFHLIESLKMEIDTERARSFEHESQYNSKLAEISAHLKEARKEIVKKDEQLATNAHEMESLCMEIDTERARAYENQNQNNSNAQVIESLKKEIETERARAYEHHENQYNSNAQVIESLKTALEAGRARALEYENQYYNKLAEFTSQLKEARDVAANRANQLLENAHVIDSLKMELETERAQALEYEKQYYNKLAEFTSQLKEARDLAANRANQLLQNAHVIDSLKMELETERAQALEDENQYASKLIEISKISEEVTKEYAKREEELQKRVKSLEKLFETNNGSTDEAKRIAVEKAEQLEDSVSTLTMQLATERSTADSDRKRDRARIAELSMLVENGTRKEAAAALKELTAAQDIDALNMEIVGLKNSICLMHDDVPELQERVSCLTLQLEAERHRARLSCSRIDELSKKVEQYEDGQQSKHSSSRATRCKDSKDRQQKQPPS